jgi:hypothetical protein
MRYDRHYKCQLSFSAFSEVETWGEHQRYMETQASSVFPHFTESTVLTPLRPVYPLQQLFAQNKLASHFFHIFIVI